MATYYRPSVRSISIESRLRSGMDTRTMVVEVALKHKNMVFMRNRQFQVVDFYETNANANVSFPFCFDSPGLSYSDFRAEVCERIPLLDPSICSQLSQRIFMYAHQLLLTRQDGVMVIMARLEIEGLEVREIDGEVEVETESVDEGIDVFNLDNNSIGEQSSNPPRGLSWGEIARLKQERFKSSGAEEEESLCSICVEEFSSGVKITPLPCSHFFHHTCIAKWLKKQGSCPLCRFDVTQACS